MADVNDLPAGQPALQEFPLYYPAAPQTFVLAGQPSGAVGAQAVSLISLTNLPHLLYGIRIDIEFDTDDLDLKNALISAGVPEACTVEISLAQQNITAGPTYLPHMTGRTSKGAPYHPLPAPFGFVGTNNLQVKLTRLISFPAVIIPVALVTLVTGQLNATNAAGTIPSGRTP